ncbi:MAG: hypothetical protein CAPSK01_001242 [Candidatus Accumulibacter vicinus]|uniref:Uncharacterized protein n=1 Tax=Candidatus Accumulibacter vicinus TaxID=2954382 RepID=A0A084Y2V7_9PROT|nr:MAG: hypothetical protein CAPSK01_001242 [Candidatus Accumulibacter vicinus]
MVVPQRVEFVERRRAGDQQADAAAVLDRRAQQPHELQQVLPLAGEEARQTFELVDADQYPRHGGEILERVEPDA